MIRVGLADDHVLVRTGFAALLDAEDDMTVVGQAADGNEAVQLATSRWSDPAGRARGYAADCVTL